MKINEIIKAARIGKRITQKELAEKIGVRKATISEFESGKHAIGSNKLDAIMIFLNLTISKRL